MSRQGVTESVTASLIQECFIVLHKKKQNSAVFWENKNNRVIKKGKIEITGKHFHLPKSFNRLRTCLCE